MYTCIGLCRAKPKCSICLLYEWADTVFWLCRAELMSNDDANIVCYLWNFKYESFLIQKSYTATLSELFGVAWMLSVWKCVLLQYFVLFMFAQGLQVYCLINYYFQCIMSYIYNRDLLLVWREGMDRDGQWHQCQYQLCGSINQKNKYRDQ